MAHVITDELKKQSAQWFATLPDEWKAWLLENIERGCSIEELVQILQQNGFAFQQQPIDSNEFSDQQVQTVSSTEINFYDQIVDLLLEKKSDVDIARYIAQQANQSRETVLDLVHEVQKNPLFQRLQQVTHQLNKREWLLSSLDQMAQLNPNYHQHVPRIETPSFKKFVQNFYSQHRPVILTKGVAHWPALKKWTPEYFAQLIGDGIIEVQMNRDQNKDFERQSPVLKQTISMRDYVEKVRYAGESNDFYMTANNTQKSQQAIAPLYADILDFGKGYCDMSLKDSLSFLWFGPKGTFTPLHHDLTNNMLVQIYGRKKITLIPALQTPHLYNDRWVFSQISNPKQVDLVQFPRYTKATPIECIIAPGEALFIPMGWWHSVESLDVSISVSFTHFNTLNQFVNQFPRAVTE